MGLNVELDMRVETDPEIDMRVDDGDEVQMRFGEGFTIVNHPQLLGRDESDQHPISAITGLAEALANSDKTELVQIFIDDEETLACHADKTPAEILTAVSEGKSVVGVIDLPFFATSLPLFEVHAEELDGEWLTTATFCMTSIYATYAGYGAFVVINNDGYGYLAIQTDPYLTEVSFNDVENALGYTPYDSSNPSGYISSITSGDVTTALGYTPYDGGTNPNGYITSSVLTDYMEKGVDYVTAGKKSGTTLGYKATAEGDNTTASGSESHAEGSSSKATGGKSHAEGEYTTASNTASHAEGSYSQAAGASSHAEGGGSKASGNCSHAEGNTTIAARQSQHVFGEYNIEETGDANTRGTYVEIVGNGTNGNTRSNARTLDWSGNEVLAGTLTVGADPTTSMEVATKNYCDTHFSTTDNKTEQMYISNPSSYSYWRGLTIGANASSTEAGALATTTDKVYVADSIRCQPSTGTVKATIFKGDLTGDVTGDVVGDVTGNVTGDLTGTASESEIAHGFFYGIIDNTSTRTAFTAQVAGITEYYTGLCVFLKNTTGSATNTNVTLNINGLGAKKIYNSQAETTQVSTQWGNNYTVLLYYDETRDSGNGGWVWYYGYNSDTNTIGYNIRTNSVTLPMADRMYRYRLMFENRNGEYVPANDSTSTNATTARTPITLPIDPFGRICYYSYTTAITQGSTPSASYQYQQYGAITLGYSFTGITLTANTPMYLVLNPRSDGLATIDQTTPVTQTLPTTDDGKLYEFLGIAIDSTTFVLTLQHPVYWYKGGAVRIYNGSPYIPDPPSADGTYTLTATVTSGVVTYSWT